ncbi:MAG TPA: hypothetical protein VFJ19_17365 [Nocardioidaceae bacterium]|nr:hypothetical protein [Nocardioidaceae bacterium]
MTDAKPSEVSLDLDTLEKESDPGPFTFRAGGERFEVRDVRDVDWQDLLTVDLGIESLRAALGDDWKRFEKVRLSGWKLDKLIAGFMRHYGLGNSGEGDASAGS